MLRQLTVPCGDWIYPSRDSITQIQYPIDFPVVAEIFLPKKLIGSPVATLSQIKYHLRGPRFLEFSVDDEAESLRIETLKNTEEENFNQSIGFDISFKLKDLPRVEAIPEGSISDSTAIFFASALLLAHIEGRPLPDGISFRDATLREIESLGKW